MRAAASDNEVKRFGVFEADLTAGELRRNGARVKLQEQPFQVLAALLEKPGDIVTKEELQRSIWNGDTFVDFDRSLATDISKIRHALGDSATRPRFIETVPKKGYRFIGLGGAPEVQDPRLTFGLPSAAIVAACLATAAMALWVALRPPTAREGPAPTLEPLTTLPGFERYPAITPDGTRVAFAWQREDDDQFDIYVKLIGLGQPRRLTSHLASELAPSWSADGGRITFARYVDSEQIAIVQVPALGGREIELTRVADFGGPILRPRQYAWAPGEEALIVSDRKRPDGPFHLFLHPLDGGPRLELTSPSEDAIGDFDASFDRSGTMSFLRGAADGRRTLYRWDPVDVAQARGKPVPVGGIPYLMYTPVLAPGGDEIVLTAWAPLPALWRVPLSHPQSPEPVLAAGQRALHPAFSADGDLLAHSTWEWDHDIWRLGAAETRCRRAARTLDSFHVRRDVA